MRLKQILSPPTKHASCAIPCSMAYFLRRSLVPVLHALVALLSESRVAVIMTCVRPLHTRAHRSRTLHQTYQTARPRRLRWRHPCYGVVIAQHLNPRNVLGPGNRALSSPQELVPGSTHNFSKTNADMRGGHCGVRVFHLHPNRL